MKISKFQIIILAIFVIFTVAGVIAFAAYKGSSGSSSLPPITIWGTFPKSSFDQYLAAINLTQAQSLAIQYVQESPATFHNDFIAALARGQGPDALLIPVDLLLPEEDKLTLIPYSALSNSLTSTYIYESSIYLTQNGIRGMPFAVDPLVMYWNRDTFNAAGIAKPPVYWDEFTGLNKAMTVKSQNGTVTRSALAMGDFANVDNARELLGSLFLQLGNPVTVVTANGSIVSALSSSVNQASPIPAISFFTQAVDPTNADYSWNRSWPDSKSAFLSGTLATYFGFASEISDIRAKNPNLNFDVAPLPQMRSGGIAADYARLYGFSIVRASPYASTVFQDISTLVAPQYLVGLTSPTSLYLPSVNLWIIQSGSTDPYITVFDRAALIARTWLDVNPTISNNILGSMIDAVTSGQKSAGSSSRRRRRAVRRGSATGHAMITINQMKQEKRFTIQDSRFKKYGATLLRSFFSLLSFLFSLPPPSSPPSIMSPPST